MRLMNLKTLMRRLPAAALCAALCVSRVSAYSGAAKALDAVPAADTTSAAIGMISTAVNTAVGSVRTTEEMSQAKAEIEARKAAEEAARKAAEEAARKAAEEAAARRRSYTSPPMGVQSAVRRPTASQRPSRLTARRWATLSSRSTAPALRAAAATAPARRPAPLHRGPYNCGRPARDPAGQQGLYRGLRRFHRRGHRRSDQGQ